MTIGSLLEGGFRLIRERPGAMLIWTIIQLIVTVASNFAMAAIFQDNLEQLMAGASLESVQASYLLKTCLVGLAGLLVTVIVYAAAQRAVIRPQEGGPGWLKLGMDEVRLAVLMLLYIVVFVVALLVVGIFTAMFVAGAGADTQSVMTLVLLLIGFVAVSYFGTKLSLTFPLTLKNRAFSIGEGWALTNGRFWTLFVTFFLIFLIMLTLGLLAMLASEPDYISAVLQHGLASPEAEQASVRQFEKLVLGEVDAPIVINWLLTAVQGGIGYALIGGAAATAVQQLTADGEGLRETFS